MTKKPGEGPPEADPEYYESLGRAIQVVRTSKGMSRRELAEASEISYPYLSEIETGKKEGSSRILLKVAGVLGMKPSELLELAESLGVANSTIDSQVRLSVSDQGPARNWFGSPMASESHAVMEMMDQSPARSVSSGRAFRSRQRPEDPKEQGLARVRAELHALIDTLDRARAEALIELLRK
ncbi:MAG TPA: helix-turn-helix transcriptional regulator [Actinomycetota bacterium]|nr:helix-turn-helix transcriptional regulator [Actinomycetota bacterium]